MRLLLNDGSKGKELVSLYERALEEAVELLIVTAYLTDWSPEIQASDQLRSLVFIVGTDFGITRKTACESVLKWLPKHLRSDFMAADEISGFHPKLVAWKSTGGQHHVVLGSSNLTEAAFSSNHEANAYAVITAKAYRRIRDWIWTIRERSVPISEDWLESYHEAPMHGGKGGGGAPPSKNPVVDFDLPAGEHIENAIRYARRRQKAFSEIGEKLRTLVTDCASGQVSSEDFYTRMMALWGAHDSRFQGRGFEITGKHADWRGVCSGLHAILEYSKSSDAIQVDHIVRAELDRLAEAGNPVRGSWLSEMLCHFFPDRYPVLNTPVREWLKHNHYRPPRGASQGAAYIDLAVKLRASLRRNTVNGATSLAELDHALWAWWDSETPDEER